MHGETVKFVKHNSLVLPAL